jgi:dUTP pyrophosphatase
MESTPIAIDYGFALLEEGAILPTKATPGSAAYDLCALYDATLGPNPIVVLTGVTAKIPPGHYLSIRERSGLALRGVRVGAGVVDADYFPRGIGVVMSVAPGFASYQIKKGDRIAQAIIERICDIAMVELKSISGAVSTHAGFGSTGK